MTSEPEILFEHRGFAGLVTLNRPQALNALTREMVGALHRQLAAWSTDEGVRHVVVRGAGERAFCAGGDIRQLHDWLRAGDLRWRDFYAEEYRLNAFIKAYPKPYIALVDGIVMGGGVGVSVHGSHRLGTSRTLFAMPEVGIGLFPDVGGSYFLPRLPQHVGFYLALTGHRARQADAAWAGILTGAIGDDSGPALVEALAVGSDADRAIAPFLVDTAPSPLANLAPEIEQVFGEPDLVSALERLEKAAHTAEWAQEAAKAVATKSPTSLCVTFRQLTEGGRLQFNDCMRMEFRIVSRLLRDRDFLEGVRAVLLEKDNAPEWSPATLEAVSEAIVNEHFQMPEWGDLLLADLSDAGAKLETGAMFEQ